MKKILIITTCILLGGCGEEVPYCEKEYKPIICELNSDRRSIFNECLDKLQFMRSTQGGNYTTNDAENLDEAIAECGIQSYSVANHEGKTVCFKNPRYTAQKDFCGKE